MTTNPSPEPLDNDVEGHGIPGIDPREMDKGATRR